MMKLLITMITRVKMLIRIKLQILRLLITMMMIVKFFANNTHADVGVAEKMMVTMRKLLITMIMMMERLKSMIMMRKLSVTMMMMRKLSITMMMMMEMLITKMMVHLNLSAQQEY